MNPILQRKADLVRAFEHAVDEAARCFDTEGVQGAAPSVRMDLDFEFTKGTHIRVAPAFDLGQPLPRDLSPHVNVVEVPDCT